MTPPPGNSDPRDYLLDLSTAAPSPATDSASSPVPNGDRGPVKSPYLSIHFKCCHVYAPIYKNAAGTAYAGHCPRCRRPTSIAIAPGGSTARIFQAE